MVSDSFESEDVSMRIEDGILHLKYKKTFLI